MRPSSFIERQLTIVSDESAIPCTIYEPENPIGLVLFGHGLSVDRFDQTVLVPARLLAGKFNFTVIVPELPFHGERADKERSWDDFTVAWQSFWAGEGRGQILREWNRIYTFAKETDLPIMFFGLSLGTQYGIMFLSQQFEIKAAVLGLFGSKPPPRSIVMNHCAPLVRAPVYFIQKLDDEIHPKETSLHLFESLGSEQKVLDASQGRHQSVSLESLNQSCSFLTGRIDD
jgi:hypothetical protein